MKEIIFLLAAMFFASCNRIVTANYEAIDYGVIEDVNYSEGKISITSSRDSMTRNWFPAVMRDGLSLNGIIYSDSLRVGEKVFVYDDRDTPIVSKVSVRDAQMINKALCRQYWKEFTASERLIAFILTALMTMGFWLFSPNNEKCTALGIVLILATTAGMVFWMAPGRMLEKVGSGKITKIEQKRFTLDDKSVYYAASPKDIFTGRQLTAGMNANVYRYGKRRDNIRESAFVSVENFDGATLGMIQIYPEIMLKTILLYWGLLFLSGTAIMPFTGKWKKQKTKKA